MLRPSRLVARLAIGALLATGGAAFLAVNSQPASGEGVSMGVVDGYAISNIHYSVDPPPPVNGVPGPLQVTTVSFTATTTTAGEMAAAQGFVKLDPPPPAPPSMWSSCTVTYSSATVTNFSCTLTPAVAVNGPGGTPVGILSNLEIEVNQ